MKRFLLGSEVHDGACRAILRESSMGKDIRLSFRREPSFFPAEKIANTWSRLVVLCDDESEKMLGFGVMSGRPVWLNGHAVELGYISQLRLIPEFQNGVYLAKGYKKFRELHEEDKRVPFYLTTIFSDNIVAKTILESRRVGLPAYVPLEELSSFFFTAKESRSKSYGEVFSSDVAVVLNEYNIHVSQGSLATRYDNETVRWLSLLEYSAFTVHGSTYSASGIVVDSSRVKQTIIDGYSVPYKVLTTLTRWCALLFGIRPPPREGAQLKSLYLIATNFSGDRDKGAHALLHHARDKAFQKNCHGVVWGLSSPNPTAKSVARNCISNTKSILYAVAWDESAIPYIQNGTDRINIEVATL